MIIILCGKSGCGKDALMKKMVSEGCRPLISSTTRPIRSGERDGVEYNFVTREKFEKMIENDELIEYRKYDTLLYGVPDVWYYGSEKRELDKCMVYVVILDIEGAKSFIEYYGKKYCFVTYINTNDEIRESRARKRGSFSEYEWARRLKDDNNVFSDDAIRQIADVSISNNGTLDECLDSLREQFGAYCFRHHDCFS